MSFTQCHAVRVCLAGLLVCLTIPSALADVFLANHGDGGQDIFRYDDSGHFLGKHRTGFSPLGLTFGPDGGLYVHETYADHTSRFDPVTGELKVFTSGGGLRPAPNIHQIAFGGPGNDLYVADMSNPGGGVVARFDGTTGVFEQRFEIGDHFGVGGLAIDSAGAIYASSRSGVIYKNSTGTFATFATVSSGVEGLTLGPDGNLYAAARCDGCGNSSVLRYKPDGTPFGVGGSLTDPTFIRDSRLVDAFSVSFGADGNLYVVNQRPGEVLRYSASGTFMDTFISRAHGMTQPSYIAFGSFAPAPVPAPATWMLFALGLVAVGSSLRRTPR